MELYGSLSSVEPWPLMQFIAERQATGRLLLSRGSWVAEVIFANGCLVSATVGQEVGLAALQFILLGFSEGEFVFSAAAAGGQQNVAAGGLDLQGHLARLASAQAELAADVPAPALVPRLSDAPIASRGTQLSVSRRALAVLLAIDGQQTVAEIAAGCGLSESVRALMHLQQLGLITFEEAPGSDGRQTTVSRPVSSASALSRSGDGVPRDPTDTHTPLRAIPEPFLARSSAGDPARWLWPAAIVLSTVGAIVAADAGIAPSFRPAIVLGFLLVCPGMAFVRLLRLGTWVAEWTLAVALSLTLDTLVAMAMVYFTVWSPTLGLTILAGLSVAGSLLQLAWALDQRRPAPRPQSTTQIQESPNESVPSGR